MNPLFSVIILCYRHFEYLYEAIDSVLKQDYPKIELIISDDGSFDFPKEEIVQYIEANKKENIKQIFIRQEEKNCGTVKHLNHAIEACTGEFVVALAGDDVLACDCVLSKYYEGFLKAEDNCYIEMAQTAMYDETLKTLNSYYLKSTVQEAIEKTNKSCETLLTQLLIYGPCLPSTSTCFKRRFFEKFGKLDEQYQLIEDFPMHIRLAEEGWIIHYENFVAIKHRHGGISHGQNGALPRSSIAYYQDLKKMIEELILKKLYLLPEKYKEQKKMVFYQRKKELRWIDFHLAQLNQNYTKMLLIAIENPFQFLWKAMEWLYPIANRLRKALLLICGALWLMIPDISEILAELLPGIWRAQITHIQTVFYYIAGGLFAIWLFMFFAWIACKIIWKLERFPIEAIVVG